MAEPEPYHLVVRRLLSEQGLARPGYTGATELWRLVTRAGHDLSQEAIRVMVDGTRRGKDRGTRTRTPEPETFEAVADALGISPGVFSEYRLAAARRQLDERALGLGPALENLQVVEQSLIGDLAGAPDEVPPTGKAVSPSARKGARASRQGQKRRRESA